MWKIILHFFLFSTTRALCGCALSVLQPELKWMVLVVGSHLPLDIYFWYGHVHRSRARPDLFLWVSDKLKIYWIENAKSTNIFFVFASYYFRDAAAIEQLANAKCRKRRESVLRNQRKRMFAELVVPTAYTAVCTLLYCSSLHHINLFVSRRHPVASRRILRVALGCVQKAKIRV